MLSITVFFVITISSILSSKKNKLFLLFIPLALIYRRCVFIDGSLIIGNMNFYSDFIFFTFFIIFYFLNNKKINFRLGLIGFGPHKTIVLLFIYLLFLIPYSFLNNIGLSGSVMYLEGISSGTFESGSFLSIIAQSRNYFYIIFYYFLFANIIKLFSFSDFISFFNVLVVVNTIIAILYVIDSSALFTVFSTEKFFVEKSTFGTIIRNFDTFPPMTFFVISFMLGKWITDKFRRFDLIIIIVNLLAVYFLYTRITLAAVLILFIVSIIIKIIRNPVKSIPKIFLLGLLAVSLIFIVSTFFLTEQNYFFSQRLLSIEKFGVEESSIVARIMLLEIVFEMIFSVNPILGIGFISGTKNYIIQVLIISGGGALGADNMWSSLLLVTGIIGSLLFLTIILLFLKSNLKYFFNNKNNYLSISMFLVILLYLLLTINSEGFLAYYYIPILFFSISTVIVNDLWNYDKIS